MYQTRDSGAGIDRVCGFRTLQEVQRRGQWKAFISVTRYDKSSRLAAPPTPRQAGNTRATRRGTVDKATASPAAHKNMTGKYMLDKSNQLFGFAWPCVRHEFWSQV